MGTILENKKDETKTAENKIAVKNPYLNGNFAPVHEELTAIDLAVRGAIPEELSGRLLRIGPNPVTAPDPAKYHWFTGNGMVHGVQIKDGKALAYSNRFVVDGKVARALGRQAIGGPTRNQDRSVNTNVLKIGGHVYALVEAGGLPIELDKDLGSVARSDFGGTLKRGFTAHPHLDPISGEYHAIAYQAGNPMLHYIVVDKAGSARLVNKIFAPHMPMVHDIAITKSLVVLLDLPVHFSMLMAVAGKFPFAWKDSAKSRLGLLPRHADAGKIQWFDVPSCYVFHLMNAYEDEGKVVVDVVKHEKVFDKYTDGPREGKITLVRWIVDRTTGGVGEIELYGQGLEFPRINEAYTGKKYRYGYTAMFAGGLELGAVHKHDLVGRATEVHDFGPQQMAGEPVFIARAGVDASGAEDCGWIMTCVYDALADSSAIHIIDAQDFSGDSSGHYSIAGTGAFWLSRQLAGGLDTGRKAQWCCKGLVKFVVECFGLAFCYIRCKGRYPCRRAPAGCAGQSQSNRGPTRLPADKTWRPRR